MVWYVYMQSITPRAHLFSSISINSPERVCVCVWLFVYYTHIAYYYYYYDYDDDVNVAYM